MRLLCAIGWHRWYALTDPPLRLGTRSGWVLSYRLRYQCRSCGKGA
jgi:hypothetical protein